MTNQLYSCTQYIDLNCGNMYSCTYCGQQVKWLILQLLLKCPSDHFPHCSEAGIGQNKHITKQLPLPLIKESYDALGYAMVRSFHFLLCHFTWRTRLIQYAHL